MSLAGCERGAQDLPLGLLRVVSRSWGSWVTGRNASEGLPAMSPEGERGGGSYYSEQATPAERVFFDWRGIAPLLAVRGAKCTAKSVNERLAVGFGESSNPLHNLQFGDHGQLVHADSGRHIEACRGPFCDREVVLDPGPS